MVIKVSDTSYPKNLLEPPKLKPIKICDQSLAVAKKIVSISIDTITLISGLNRIILSIGNAARDIFKNSQTLTRILDQTKHIISYVNLSQILLAPLHFYNIFHRIYEVFKGEIDIKEYFLEELKSIGLLVSSIITFLRDLAYIGVIPLKLAQKLWPFNILEVIISAISLISEARGWHDSAKFSKKFLEAFDEHKEVSQFGKDDYIEMARFILKQDTKKLKRITDVDGNELIARVSSVCQKALAKDTDQASLKDRTQAKKDFHEAMLTLKNRIKNKITASKVGVTANSVKLVASTVTFSATAISALCPVTLVAVPVFVGTAYAASGLADAANLVQFATNAIKNKKFLNSALMKKPV